LYYKLKHPRLTTSYNNYVVYPPTLNYSVWPVLYSLLHEILNAYHKNTRYAHSYQNMHAVILLNINEVSSMFILERYRKINTSFQHKL